MTWIHSGYSLPVVFALAALCAAPAVADDACMTAVHANIGARSYEGTMSMTRPGGSASSLNGFTVDMVKPDSISVHEKAMDLIAIGNKTWMRESGGAWKAMPYSMGSMVSMNPEQFLTSKGKMSCTAAGTQPWDGQSASVYNTAYEDAKGRNMHGTMFVLPDGFIHHVTWTASDGSTGSMNFTKFNAVTISPP